MSFLGLKEAYWTCGSLYSDLAIHFHSMEQNFLAFVSKRRLIILRKSQCVCSPFPALLGQQIDAAPAHILFLPCGHPLSSLSSLFFSTELLLCLSQVPFLKTNETPDERTAITRQRENSDVQVPCLWINHGPREQRLSGVLSTNLI